MWARGYLDAGNKSESRDGTMARTSLFQLRTKQTCIVND